MSRLRIILLVMLALVAGGVSLLLTLRSGGLEEPARPPEPAKSPPVTPASPAAASDVRPAPRPTPAASAAVPPGTSEPKPPPTTATLHGVLTATPQGVKYTTSHASDAFDAPLADITALELDYLAKNLRLKLKSGKTYNFAEAGGGADQLYVFQRDVDKARKGKDPVMW